MKGINLNEIVKQNNRLLAKKGETIMIFCETKQRFIEAGSNWQRFFTARLWSVAFKKPFSMWKPYGPFLSPESK
jgi:hypothetical protein